MNIFILDEDLSKCAIAHNDKHVVKMITEYAQLLSGALRYQCPGVNIGYKLTHVNHPCSKWVRESMHNWVWLRELTTALHDEYQYRYNKEVNHKAFDVVLTLPVPGNLPQVGLTPFKLAMPDQYKCDDPVIAYRNYYMGEKRHIAQWRNRPIPTWWA